MNQHPVPQNISSYEFKLVGDMTLKQFFQLAGGAIIALIFYATPLPALIKWPLVFIFGALGAALAFLPVEERPLSTWIIAFLKAVYSPTKYVYSAASVDDVFAKTKTTDTTTIVPQKLVAEKPGFLETFENAEKSFIQKVSVLFQTTSDHGEKTMAQPQQIPGVPQKVEHEGLTEGRILEIQDQSPIAPQHPQQPSNRPAFKIVEEIDIPKIQTVKVGLAPQVGQAAPQSISEESSQQTVSPLFTSSQNQAGLKQATFAPDAAPPSPPTIPNTVVGQVLTAEGKIVDGAILEIKDLTGKPVRALKTNKVGHFITVTPLTNGDYQIETEKEGLVFDPVTFNAIGTIVPSIQIRSK